ncbi:carboxymuconolactone decarboxylase family protein [Halocatena salina]|uniref:Carboxymuconolactone decarboxylase family protein n=1 Tax=Halocatena salina TaxID=2934340 RepID=A0A8U0A2K3_9EURY|nr:carboxymuconolactone decarboxylase family protein [Halocatena salina]UPM42217.1 carboxymuconolactone decarboxylase family protein [Halocatena salina]
MVSDNTRNEIEQYLGQVPSWMRALAEPASDHSWGVVRDLEFGDTELTQREKELVGLGAATAMNCPYCIHFHTEGAKMEDVTEEELREATNVAANVQYFSSILHGAEVDYEEFVDETTEIVDHIETQRTAVGDD